MTVLESKRSRNLESENTRLEKLLAESLLEIEVTREVFRKKWYAHQRCLVRELKCKGLTERHALEVVSMSASALRYAARNEGNDALRTAILALAHRNTRYGW